MDNLKKQYRDLEMKTLSRLKNAVNISNKESKHLNTKSIAVNIFDCEELVIINDRLTFLDNNGLHYNAIECPLQDLIDILNK